MDSFSPERWQWYEEKCRAEQLAWLRDLSIAESLTVLGGSFAPRSGLVVFTGPDIEIAAGAVIFDQVDMTVPDQRVTFADGTSMFVNSMWHAEGTAGHPVTFEVHLIGVL